MIIKIFDNEFNFNTKGQDGRAVMERIMEDIEKEKKALSHLVIDGNEIRNDLIKYIDDNLNSIERIDVYAIERIQLPLENAAVVKESLDGMIRIMDILAEDFRMGVSARGWKEFESMIDTVLFLDKATKSIFSMFIDAGDSRKTGAWDRIREEYRKLSKILPRLEESLDKDDTKGAGDMIQNEMKPIFVSVSEMIGNLIGQN